MPYWSAKAGPGRFHLALAICFAGCLALTCKGDWPAGSNQQGVSADQNCAPYDFGLPSDEMAAPPHPPDACVTPERVALGRRLFYDRRLSRHKNQSCADCHVQARGFTDGRVASVGSTGQVHPRNALGLANVGYFATLTWFNPELTRFDNQALVSLFSENTKTTIEEMAISSKEWVVTDRLLADPEYPALFAAAYPEAGIDPAESRTNTAGQLVPGDQRPRVRAIMDVTHMVRALAAFQATLVSRRSPYDRGVLSPAARRGEALFRSERAGCLACHSGPFLNYDAGTERPGYHNVGLYNVGGTGDYPDQSLHGRAAPRKSQGLHLITKRPEDRGKFRTPSLRNVAVTGPYMHDGSVSNLVAAVRHFAAGGRNVTAGPLAGDGRAHPNKAAGVRAFALTAGETRDLLAFLESLTDDCFLNDPRLSDPAADPAPELPAHCRS